MCLPHCPKSPQERNSTGKEYTSLCYQSGRFLAAGVGSRESSLGWVPTTQEKHPRPCRLPLTLLRPLVLLQCCLY